MHKFLLSTATAALALGLAGAPAMANNMPQDMAATDCQTQLEQLEQKLDEQDLDQMAMREVDRQMQRAEKALDNNNNRECMTIVSSLEGEYLKGEYKSDQMARAGQKRQEAWGGESASQTITRRGTSGERIIVDQPEPEVAVTQPAPRVRVQQVAPEISISQAQPEVMVEERAAKITIMQPPPQIVIERAEPKVSVRMPEPVVGVKQQNVQVSVVQPEPEISVQQGEPSVRFVDAEPEIVLQDSGEADISFSRAEPEVNISEQGEAETAMGEPEDMGWFEDRQEQTAMTDTDAEALAETQPSAGADMGMTRTPPMPSATGTEAGTEMGADTETKAQTSVQAGMAMEVLIARDIIGMDLNTVEGDTIGEVDDIVFDTTGKYYIVVKSGGFLGLGEKTRYVPMDRVSVGEDALMVMSETDLQSGFDKTRFTSVGPDFEMEAGTL